MFQAWSYLLTAVFTPSRSATLSSSYSTCRILPGYFQLNFNISKFPFENQKHGRHCTGTKSFLFIVLPVFFKYNYKGPIAIHIWMPFRSSSKLCILANSYPYPAVQCSLQPFQKTSNIQDDCQLSVDCGNSIHKKKLNFQIINFPYQIFVVVLQSSPTPLHSYFPCLCASKLSAVQPSLTSYQISIALQGYGLRDILSIFLHCTTCRDVRLETFGE